VGRLASSTRVLEGVSADIERDMRIMVKGGKFGTYIEEKLLLVLKDKTRSEDSVLRGQQQVRGVDQGALLPSRVKRRHRDVRRTERRPYTAGSMPQSARGAAVFAPRRLVVRAAPIIRPLLR